MWIKICGIKDPHTATAIANAGADAIGLNFYTSSVRCVGLDAATEIVDELAHQVELIGLFVNHSIEEIVETCEQTGLASIQLHGDEPPSFLHELQNRFGKCVANRPDSQTGNVKIYRAFRIGEEGCSAMADYLAECRQQQICLAGCLVDSFVQGEFGGTGHTAPWNLLAQEYDADRWPRLIVAGGLTPSNVKQAIKATHPFGVDVASGVESQRGVKDLNLVAEFIANARS